VRPAAELSRYDPAFETDLQGFIGKYVQWWQDSATAAPVLPLTTYTPADQRANESKTIRLMDSMEEEFRDYPAEEDRQSAWRERAFAGLRQFGKCFGFADSHFDIIFSPEYFAATKAFVREARSFDRKMKTAALAQALRNVWVMNCLQIFLGDRPSLTPSIFAYSMLYPYTDNHLDLPNLSAQSKEIACRRLGLRLSGMPLAPADAHETAVFRLIGMIEDEFPRAAFPEVHSSLLAIHAGQVRSLSQQRKSSTLDQGQLLAISVAKGGASVLADGWLAAGRLDREQADFCFGFGVVLQLLDDLQDLYDDRAAGHTTLFTRAADAKQLDGITGQLWTFMHRVFDSIDRFSLPRGLELKDLIRRNSAMLMMRSMAECTDCFSGAFLHQMERLAPVRFAFMKECRREIESRFRKVWPALARRRKLRSVFDLLGS